ncbi:MAG: hypothetical protein ISS31_09820 [Kiritimatiellae bacterium]|nr:hypothetical protein [Kiritimatiellia bacterium]
MSCRIRYSDVARELNVSTTTIKAWSETLESLGYYKRTPCGPAGVDVQLCPEAWPCPSTGTALTSTLETAASVIDALRLTLSKALDSTAAEFRQMREAAA